MERKKEERRERPSREINLPNEAANKLPFLFEDEELPGERPKDDAEWSVAWADLMMTLFVMFAMMFIYMKSERNVTEAFTPGDGTGAPEQGMTNQFMASQSPSVFSDPTRFSTDKPSQVSPAPEPDPAGSGLRPEEILKLAEEAIQETDLENIEVMLQDDETVKISLRGPLLFDLGSADLREQTQSFLNKVALVLAQTENEVNVVGHTDTFPIYTPKFPTNWELSVARAAAVARYMIRVADLEPGRFTIMGHSMYRPALPNTNMKNKQLNRRVEILITKKLYIKSPFT